MSILQPISIACSRFCYYGLYLFLPFIGDYDTVAERDIGRYSNHPPAFRSQAVHLRLGLADAVDFNAIFIHGLFLPALFVLMVPDHAEQTACHDEQQADDQHGC